MTGTVTETAGQIQTVYLAGGIVIMAGVTYLIRVIPMAVFRKKITNRFVRSF